MTFEEALERLNAISAELENPEITLKSAVELYTEATELVKICNKEIDAARITLEKVEK